MTPISSSSDAEQADSLFKSSSESTKYYRDFVANLIDDEEESSLSSSEVIDFVPYNLFWQLPPPKLEEK